ncbi:helix-turn-helix transcriptional regulator [Streptomyces lavenduligriseus]|uniref:Helix-turn-helix transcriptional regulator n=1 Tax=Streptomyces lavenduligriseus TaxID=67315 RepID=A0ABT0P019_9ACTN|nr:helix-turn-helix transcriptional regulator [Streptomyces lavenduligriseus]MCL3997069.1 helix-turn-helix transcriptional regulator [Streptomyces lavenduligriseus]
MTLGDEGAEPWGDKGVALDADALAVYRAVLLHREGDPAALAAILGMSDRRVRAACGRLTELALLRPSRDRPDLIRAVSPDLGLELMLQREQQELLLRQERLAQTRSALRLLATEYAAAGGSADRSPDAVEVLRGMDEIRTRLESLAGRCTREVLSFQPGGALPTEALEASRPLNEQAMVRGVRFRTIYLQSITTDRVTTQYVRWARELGGDIRLAPTLPMRLLIVDHEVAVIPGETRACLPTALLLRSAPVVRALHALFEAYWKDAEPFGTEPKDAPTVGPTAQERAVLRLLADGCKDETVARALGISVRTERRMVAELTARLGASSRFELAVKATRSGWV